jgi:hypothetical protein
VQNYAQLLDAAAKSDTTGQAASLKANLDSIVKFRNGVKEYTDSVKRAAAGSGELYSGIDDMKKFTEDLVAKEFVLDIDNLTSFIKASDNARIAAAAGDVIMNKIGGIIAGVIVLILFYLRHFRVRCPPDRAGVGHHRRTVLPRSKEKRSPAPLYHHTDHCSLYRRTVRHSAGLHSLWHLNADG